MPVVQNIVGANRWLEPMIGRTETALHRFAIAFMRFGLVEKL